MEINKSLISGYIITETLHNGTQSQVYRVIREFDQQPFIIKIPKKDFPSFDELLKFRNQYALIKDLKIEGIVKPITLEQYQDKLLLIMPDTHSVDLQQHLNNDRISISEFFIISIAMAKVLDALYQNRIIHKDIKPENILFQPDNKQCQLIDFSISTTLPREIQSLKSPDVLEGTLAYMPPEQTGRMNRGIDYRSDFYSLGVTFYKILTGQLPFICDDAMEQVHCHLAKIPESPMLLNSAIPQTLSDIILKLMEKNAEDRYQSADGLLKDLEICQQQWLKNGKVIPFNIGQYDIARQFAIPEKLYGREQEVNRLFETFDYISNDQPAMLLVTGLPGIGKTALVNEIHKSIVRDRGYFIKGKYDQYNRNQPFFALIQAVQMMIQQLLNEQPDAVKIWQNRIQSALGQQAQVMTDLIPELEQLIGKQPIAAELQGSAATNRFQNLFLSLLQAITRHHPLVIFLDDLQWIDIASLQLFPVLMQTIETQPLLLIGAYRDNEVTSGHPLLSVLQELKQTNLRIENIHLESLTQIDLAKMITDACLCGQSKVAELTKLVHQKTLGNPFFAHRFMSVLHEEKLVKFDYDAGQWDFDLPQIAQLAANDDVVAFMMARISKLLPQTQFILQQAACMGNQFDLETLVIISAKTHTECIHALLPAMKADFVIALSDNYKVFLDDHSNTSSMNINVKYRFSHDRVQQAAYAMIPEVYKAATHLKIGRLLKQHQRDTSKSVHLLDITNQLNLGSELITDLSERDELATLNHQSGDKAKTATAYVSALQYYSAGISFLGEQCWQNNYPLSLSLYESAAEAAFLTGDFKLMNNYKMMVVKQAKTFIETIKVHQLHCLELIAKTQITDVIKYALELLKNLGYALSENPSKYGIQLVFNELQHLLKEETMDAIIERPKMKNNAALAANQLIVTIISPVHDANPDLFSLIVMTGIKLSLIYGNSPASILIYGNYGQLLISQYHDAENGYKYGQLSLKLLDQLNSIESTAQAYAVFYGTITPWTEPLKNAIAPAQVGYQCGFETGDYLFASVNIFGYSMAAYYAGMELSQLNEKAGEYSKPLLPCNKRPLPTGIILPISLF